MKLSVFGLGYVGCVSAACFAKEGHEVMGVDVNPLKVEIINSGKSPIVESGIGELIDEMVNAGRLRATTEVAGALRAMSDRGRRNQLGTRRRHGCARGARRLRQSSPSRAGRADRSG